MPVYPGSTFHSVHYFHANVWPRSVPLGGGFHVLALVSPGTSSEKVAFSDNTQVTCAAALTTWQSAIGEDPVTIPQSLALVKARFLLRTVADDNGAVEVAKVEVASTGSGLIATVEIDHKVVAAQAVNTVVDGINLGVTALTNAYAVPNSAEADYIYGSSS